MARCSGTGSGHGNRGGAATATERSAGFTADVRARSSTGAAGNGHMSCAGSAGNSTLTRIQRTRWNDVGAGHTDESRGL